MSSSQTLRFRTPRSREKKALNPNPPQVSGNEALRTTRRARNANFALSIGDIRRAATKSVGDLTQKRRTDQIDPWGVETPKKTCVSRPEKLPEKFEMLGDIFNGFDTSIWLLRLRGLKPSFSNIECVTDRRFTYCHLDQLKFVMPEVIEIKKVLIKDERTSCLKLDLHVTINADALESEGKSKSEGGGSMHLRKSFHKRLADLSKSHPEDYEIPEGTLLQPFGLMKQDMRSDTDKLPLSSSQGDEISDTVKLPLSSSQVGCSFSTTVNGERFFNVPGTQGDSPLVPIQVASFLLQCMELSYPQTYILSTPCFVCIYTVPYIYSHPFRTNCYLVASGSIVV